MAEQAERFAISVGYNNPPNRALRRLRYADDDAVQNYRLMRSLGASAVLLTVLDRESAQLHPELRPASPTVAALDAALKALNRRIALAKARGKRTALYLFYSGHGGLQAGEGYVQLKDRRLTRKVLASLMRRSRADVNHLIVDACNSYHLVFPRGPGGKRRAVAGRLFGRDGAVPANTGVLLSTSSARQSHEWEAWQAGVFSHEVRSALRGAADADRDERVSYEEAAAFVFTANRAIRNARFRPQIFARPPRAASTAPLVDLRGLRGRWVTFGPPLEGHQYVEDVDGVRLVDLHPGPAGVTVLLPATGRLYARASRSRQERVLPVKASVLVSRQPPRPREVSARGAEHEAFLRLFSQPFTRRALETYRAESARVERAAELVLKPRQRAPSGSWLRPAVGITALAAVALGGTFSGLAAYQRSTVTERTRQVERGEINGRITTYNRVAITSYIVGGAAGLSYLLWKLWSKKKEVRVEVGGGPDGGMVTAGGQW